MSTKNTIHDRKQTNALMLAQNGNRNVAHSYHYIWSQRSASSMIITKQNSIMSATHMNKQLNSY